MMTGLSLNRFLQAIYLSRENVVYLLPVEHFLVEQGRGNGVQARRCCSRRRALALSKHCVTIALQLCVYLLGGGLAEVPLALHLLAEEDRLFLLAVVEGTEVLAHAPLADHLSRDLRGPLYVVARPGCLVVEDDLFRRPSS